MSITKVTITKECVKRLKKQGHEIVSLPNGDTLLIEWSNAKDKLTAEQVAAAGLRGAGCYVRIDSESKP